MDRWARRKRAEIIEKWTQRHVLDELKEMEDDDSDVYHDHQQHVIIMITS